MKYYQWFTLSVVFFIGCKPITNSPIINGPGQVSKIVTAAPTVPVVTPTVPVVTPTVPVVTPTVPVVTPTIPVVTPTVPVVTIPLAPVVVPSQTTMFPATEIWYQRIDTSSVDARSSNIIAALATQGWGTGQFQVQVLNSFHILKADKNTPRYGFIDINPGDASCDVINQIPLPPGGAIEGHTGYTCPFDNEDCHLLIVDTDAKKLYEIYRANVIGNVVRGDCPVVWDLSTNYWPQSDTHFTAQGRGDQCTSADAAGFPVAPLLATADEVYDGIKTGRGDVGHALRFILPNDFMRKYTFIHPATHAGQPSNVNPNSIPMGARLRLKSTFDVSKLPNEAARVIARSLIRYGMLLADGGNIAMNLQDDKFTTHKWTEWGFQQLDLASLKVTDFEMVTGGPDIALTYDCVRVK